MNDEEGRRVFHPQRTRKYFLPAFSFSISADPNSDNAIFRHLISRDDKIREMRELYDGQHCSASRSMRIINNVDHENHEKLTRALTT